MPLNAKTHKDCRVFQIYRVLSTGGFKFSSTCAYPLCEGDYGATVHSVETCPSLHTRCRRCGFKGHGYKKNTTDICTDFDFDNFEVMRALFEDWAEKGIYTRLRRRLPRYGFYPIPHKVDAETFVYNDYDELASFPVFVASEKMKNA